MSASNPDRSRLLTFLANPDTPISFDSSPLLQALGTTIVEATEGRIVLNFEPSAIFLQGANVVQGGAVSAMLDFAMAAAVMTKLESNISFATASLSDSFLAAVRTGRLTAVGEVDRIGRRNGFARATMTDAAGVALATASSVVTIIAST